MCLTNRGATIGLQVFFYIVVFFIQIYQEAEIAEGRLSELKETIKKSQTNKFQKELVNKSRVLRHMGFIKRDAGILTKKAMVIFFNCSTVNRALRSGSTSKCRACPQTICNFFHPMYFRKLFVYGIETQKLFFTELPLENL